MPRPLTWLYQRLGPRYPAVFITLELQSAFVVVIGAVALASFYYEADKAAYVRVLLLTLGLTAIALAIVIVRVQRRLRPLRNWIAGDRSPSATEDAWRVAVGFPLEMIRRDFYFPILVLIPATAAAVAMLGLAWLAFFPTLLIGALSIAYSGTLHYLAIETGMRPVLFDINAALKAPMRIDKPALPLRVKLLATLPLINVITGMTVAALTADGGGIGALGLDVLIALAVAFTVSFELVVLLSRSILRPVEDLEAATERIRQGRFDEHIPITTADEFGELSSAFNQMTDGLAEREQLRAAFGAYLDEEVARHIISEGYDPTGSEVEVSLLFCDVRDFTEAASESTASEVVSRLNELFEVIVPIVGRHRGHVDQFLGDGLLAVFGAPQRIPDHADRAVQAAIEIARTVNSRHPGGFEIGIGVNSGTVVAGSIGGAGRLSFSVIGDAVNLCARVEAETRLTGDAVLITGTTHALLDETMEVRSVGAREIKGYKDPIELYAPLVPRAVEPEISGTDISEYPRPAGSIGLGRPAARPDGLGKRPDDDLGRSSGGAGGTYTLPGA